MGALQKVFLLGHWLHVSPCTLFWSLQGFHIISDSKLKHKRMEEMGRELVFKLHLNCEMETRYQIVKIKHNQEAIPLLLQ